jgi:nitric oxide reductase subunit C
MTDRGPKLVLWVGTLSSAALFLALTFDTHRHFDALTHADRLDETVVAGKRAFEAHNCNDCHTILGFGGYFAPDLTRVTTRMGEDAIRLRLEQPEKALVHSWRKMPKKAFAAGEIDALVAFFAWVAEIENNDWPPQDSERKWKAAGRKALAGAAMTPGAALVAQESCLSCHALGEQGEHRGPRFEWIARRRSAQAIADALADPEKLTPGSAMPSFARLDAGQRLTLGQFITSLADGKGEQP